MTPQIRTIPNYGTFEEILTASDSETQNLARRLRALIAEVRPGVIEVP